MDRFTRRRWGIHSGGLEHGEGGPTWTVAWRLSVASSRSGCLRNAYQTAHVGGPPPQLPLCPVLHHRSHEPPFLL